MYRTIIFGLAAALMMAGKASAQTHLPAGNGPAAVTANKTLDAASRDLRKLSPGNQQIARALFLAQQVVDGSRFWSLDGIARAKQRAKQQGAGWGTVFNQMKRDGLIRERSIGQIIVAQDKIRNTKATGGAHLVRHEKSYRSNVVVTTANGRQVVVGLASPALNPRRLAYASVKQAPAKPVKKVKMAKLEPARPAPPAQVAPMVQKRRIVYRLFTPKAKIR